MTLSDPLARIARRVSLALLLLGAARGAAQSPPATGPGLASAVEAIGHSPITPPSAPLIIRALQPADLSRLPECSGLVASRRYPGRLYANNDHGNPPLLHALDTLGHYLGAFTAPGLTNHDWEELSLLEGRPLPAGGAAPDSLLICDIGDNLRPDRGVRHHVRLYRLPEPEWIAGPSLARPDSMWVQYADGPRDAEALLPDPATGELVILSKRDVPSRVYRLRPVWQAGAATVVAHYVGPLGSQATFVTAASLSPAQPDGRRWALVRSITTWLLFEVGPGQSVAQALLGQPTVLETHAPRFQAQGESVAWAPDSQSLFSLSEENKADPQPRMLRLTWRR